jgi:hypothetical protein
MIRAINIANCFINLSVLLLAAGSLPLKGQGETGQQVTVGAQAAGFANERMKASSPRRVLSRSLTRLTAMVQT